MSFPDPSFLKLLRCPQKHSELVELTADQLQGLNDRIRSGAIKNSDGQTVTQELGSGLINVEGSRVYAIRDGIIQLIVDEAIVLDPTL